MNENVANESYDRTLAGLRKGDSIEKYERQIKKQLAKENYERCAGIKRAIERFKKYKK